FIVEVIRLGVNRVQRGCAVNAVVTLNAMHQQQQFKALDRHGARQHLVSPSGRYDEHRARHFVEDHVQQIGAGAINSAVAARQLCVIVQNSVNVEEDDGTVGK